MFSDFFRFLKIFCTKAIFILWFRILDLVTHFKHRNHYQKLPKLNGKWNYLEPKLLFDKFPYVCAFSDGFWIDKILCYNPRLVRLLIDNSDKATSYLTIDELIIRGTSIGSREAGTELKLLRNALHRCLRSRHSFITVCRDHCASSINEIEFSGKHSVIMNIHNLMSDLAVKLPMETFFGKLNSHTEKELLHHIKQIHSRSRTRTKTNGFGCDSFRCAFDAYKLRRKTENFLKKILAMKRNSIIGDNCYCVLDNIICLERVGKIILSDEQIYGVFSSYLTFVAAIKTSFAWLIRTLGEHPDWQNKILTEIIATKNQRNSKSNISLENLPNLDMFISESMRHHAAPVMTRRVTKSFQFEGYTFPVRAIIEIDNQLLHSNPRFWKSPDKFMPERFSSNVERELYQYVPFWAGERTCISKSINMPLMKMFVISYVECLDFGTKDGTNFLPVPFIKITKR